MHRAPRSLLVRTPPGKCVAIDASAGMTAGDLCCRVVPTGGAHLYRQGRKLSPTRRLLDELDACASDLVGFECRLGVLGGMDELAEVKQDIKKVEAELLAVGEEIRDLTAEIKKCGDADEKKRLCAKEEQLRKKEEQLREEKLLLLKQQSGTRSPHSSLCVSRLTSSLNTPSLQCAHTFCLCLWRRRRGSCWRRRRR